MTRIQIGGRDTSGITNCVTIVGLDPAILGKWERPKRTIHERRQRVAAWLAWKRAGGYVDGDEMCGGYVDLNGCVDGWYSSAALRRIADAMDEYARIMAGWG